MPRGGFKRTVTLDLERFPSSTSRVNIVKAIKDRFAGYTVLSVQFVPGNRAQVTFDRAEHKEFIETLETVSFGDVECRVVGGGPRPQFVHVFHYPYEADDDLLMKVFKKFGDVLGLTHQHYPDHNDICTGVRLLHILRSSPIPRNVDVGGWAVKVWYRGMPPECDICGQGHVGKDCPLRGKCRRCRQPGHVSRNCTNLPSAWDSPDADNLVNADPTPAEAAASASGPSGVASSSSPDGVPPAVAIPAAPQIDVASYIMDVDCAPAEPVASAPVSPAAALPSLSVSVCPVDVASAASQMVVDASIDLRDNELSPALFSADDSSANEVVTVVSEGFVVSGSDSLEGCVSLTVDDIGSEADHPIFNSASSAIINVIPTVSSGVKSCTVNPAAKGDGVTAKDYNNNSVNSTVSSGAKSSTVNPTVSSGSITAKKSNANTDNTAVKAAMV